MLNPCVVVLDWYMFCLSWVYIGWAALGVIHPCHKSTYFNYDLVDYWTDRDFGDEDNG